MRNRKQHFTTKNTHSRSGMGKKNENTINQYNERYNSIKQPNSIEEFRENLLKYYFSIGDMIYTQELGYVSVNELNSIEDLIEKVEQRDYSTLNLTPKVVELQKWDKYVNVNYILSDVFQPEEFYEKFWMKEDTHVIIQNDMEFMKVCPKVMGSIYWKNILQPQELYQFYHHKVMGEYGLYPDFQITKNIIYSII
jgi:hypothetical protein